MLAFISNQHCAEVQSHRSLAADSCYRPDFVLKVENKNKALCSLLLLHGGEKPLSCFLRWQLNLCTSYLKHILGALFLQKQPLPEPTSHRAFTELGTMTAESPPLWLNNHSDHSALWPAWPEVWDYKRHGYELASGEHYLPTHTVT